MAKYVTEDKLIRYTAALKLNATVLDRNKPYVVGDVVQKGNVFLKCITAGTTATTALTLSSVINTILTDGTVDWQVIDPFAETKIRDWESGVKYEVSRIVKYNGSLYRCLTTNMDATFTIANWELLVRGITDWTSGENYVVGQFVIYNGALYECITANNDSTFNSTNWQKIAGGGLYTWATNTSYSVGDVVIYNNNIYQCNTTHTSGSTFNPDASKWTEISACITRIPNWQTSTDYVVGDLVAHDAKIYRCTIAHRSDSTQWNSTEEANWEELSPTINEISMWAVSTNYAVGQLVIHNNKLYRCNTAHTSDSTSFNTDIAYWDEIGSSGGIESWRANELYTQGNMVIYNNKIYVCDTAHTSANPFDYTKWHEVSTADIPLWNSNVGYLVGNNVIYNNKLYRCTTAHTSGSTFDSTKWDEISPYDIDLWQASTAYKVGNLVINDNQIYRCKTAHTSSSTFSSDITNWDILDTKWQAKDWTSNKLYLIDEVVSYDDVLYKANTNHVSSSTIGPDESKLDFVYANLRPWASNTYYREGSIVTYNGGVYQCLTSHTSGDYFKHKYIYNGDGHIWYRRTGDTTWNVTINSYTFDFGSIQKILSIQGSFHSKSAKYQQLDFSISDDNINFEPVYTLYSPHSGDITETFDKVFDIPISGRYLKVDASNLIEWSPPKEFKLDVLKIVGVNTYWQLLSGYPLWESNNEYIQGDMVTYNSNVYKCMVNNSDVNFDESKWEPIDKDCFIFDWSVNILYYVDEVVKYDSGLYRCKTQHISLEPPINAKLYEATTNVIEVDNTTTIPYTETIDIGTIQKVTDIDYTESTTDMSFTYTIETSEDNTTFTTWTGNSIDARYIRLTVDSVNIVSGATSPKAYLDNFTVYGDSDKWEKISFGGDTPATLAQIQSLF